MTLLLGKRLCLNIACCLSYWHCPRINLYHFTLPDILVFIPIGAMHCGPCVARQARVLAPSGAETWVTLTAWLSCRRAPLPLSMRGRRALVDDFSLENSDSEELPASPTPSSGPPRTPTPSSELSQDPGPPAHSVNNSEWRNPRLLHTRARARARLWQPGALGAEGATCTQHVTLAKYTKPEIRR